MLDVAIIGVPIGLFFGRCANFVNGELWGAPTDLPWGVVFGGSAGMMPRHPSQLYEALLEGAVLFAIPVSYTHLPMKVIPPTRSIDIECFATKIQARNGRCFHGFGIHAT